MGSQKSSALGKGEVNVLASISFVVVYILKWVQESDTVVSRLLLKPHMPRSLPMLNKSEVPSRTRLHVADSSASLCQLIHCKYGSIPVVNQHLLVIRLFNLFCQELRHSATGLTLLWERAGTNCLDL